MPIKGRYDDSCVNLLLNENKIELLEPFHGSKQHHLMKCLICNHEWSATPISKRQAFKNRGVSGCPNCADLARYGDIRASHVEDFTSRGIEVLTPGYDGRLRVDYTQRMRDEKITVRNNICGHTFDVSPLNLIQSTVQCSVCATSESTRRLTESSRERSDAWKLTASDWQLYKSEVTALTEQTYTTNEHNINPAGFTRAKAGIRGGYHLDHIVPKRFCFDNNIPASVCADVSNLQLIPWEANVGARSYVKGVLSPLFQRYIDDNIDVVGTAAWIQQIVGGDTFARVRDTVATVYNQDTNHAVYVIPTSKRYGNQRIASTIADSLEGSGITHSIIFYDELASHRELIARKLAHYTGVSTTPRIHARSCTIREVSDKREKSALLRDHHMQGNDTAPIAIGAYYESKLIAVMTFTRPRRALGQRDVSTYTTWELCRFCTDTRVRIPGIASRLLSYFKHHYEWTEIYSYADRRWSVGNMYERIGFARTSTTAPDYFYIVNGVRKHRWNYRKDVLPSKLTSFDATVSEYQNMVDNGYWRVWDCGSYKYVLHNSGNDK